MRRIGPRRPRGRPRHPDVLTRAEWHVAALASSGMSNRQIAGRRGVTVHTVRAQVASILGKLELTSRQSLREWEAQMVTERAGNVILTCSFCGKPDRSVEYLLAGPKGIHICVECVEVCNGIIARTRAAAG